MKAPVKVNPITLWIKVQWLKCCFFWQEVRKEITRGILQWFPAKPKEMTVREALKELKGYNKNKLITILTNILAEKQRVIPICSNKKEVKTWSKRELIACIINELANKKDPSYKAEAMKELERKVRLV